MSSQSRPLSQPFAGPLRWRLLALMVGLAVLWSPLTFAQGLTGALLGTVKDDHGGVVVGARVQISSPSLIGGPATLTTNDKGQLRFPALSPGAYVLDVETAGFASYHEENIAIGAGATIERTVSLKLAGVAESIIVEGAGSRIEARDSGFGELGPFHPGVTPITTAAFDPVTGGYTRIVSVVDSKVLRVNPETRAPRTDEYSIGVDCELGRRLAVAIAYVRKEGANFIGWTDIGGQYREEAGTLPDGRSVPVFVLTGSSCSSTCSMC